MIRILIFIQLRFYKEVFVESPYLVQGLGVISFFFTFAVNVDGPSRDLRLGFQDVAVSCFIWAAPL